MIGRATHCRYQQPLCIARNHERVAFEPVSHERRIGIAIGAPDVVVDKFTHHALAIGGCEQPLE